MLWLSSAENLKKEAFRRKLLFFFTAGTWQTMFSGSFFLIYSTVTLFARFLGLSTSSPLPTDI